MELVELRLIGYDATAVKVVPLLVFSFRRFMRDVTCRHMQSLLP